MYNKLVILMNKCIINHIKPVNMLLSVKIE